MSPAIERMSADDARILGLENRAITGHTMKLVIVGAGEGGRPLELDPLRARVEERLALAPRVRQRAVPAPLRIAPPAWVDDPGFDLAEHVVAGPGPLDEDGLVARAGELMAQRLDHERPLWQIEVVPLIDGRTALIARIHHAMADGIACLRLLRTLLWDDEPTAGPAPAPQVPSEGRLLSDAVATRARGIADGALSAGRTALSPARWRHAVADLAEMPGALRRELRGSSGPAPFDRPLGAGRSLAGASAALAELKRIERAIGEGATVNDVLLAAIGGGIRRWLERRGEGLGPIRVKIPVSMHAREERGSLGNRDSFIFADLDVEEDDPLLRLRAVAAATRERKQRHDADELYRFFHATSHLRPLSHAVERRAMDPRTFGLSVSNVPGPREAVRLDGRLVVDLRTFAEPADHHVLRASAVSLAGTLAIGLCADPESVDHLDGLGEGIGAELTALGEAAG